MTLYKIGFMGGLLGGFAAFSFGIYPKVFFLKTVYFPTTVDKGVDSYEMQAILCYDG